MKIIRSIRLYYTDMNNMDGYAMPMPINEPHLEAIAHRLAMKLHEMEFPLDDHADELKINFTPCLPIGSVRQSMRTTSHRKSHYVDVGVSRDIYDRINTRDDAVEDVVIAGIRKALSTFYATDHELHTIISDVFYDATYYGEDLEITILDKESFFNHATISVCYRDSGVYLPLLHIEDRMGNMLIHEELAPVDDLDAIGNLHVGIKKAVLYSGYGGRGESLVFRWD